MIRVGWAFAAPLCLGLALAPATGHAQADGAGLIDGDLRGQIDFRDVSFAHCLGQPQCMAQGVTITAERRAVDGQTWDSAQLYWDPVDGIGVMAGGQNDEIDFDERILITFDGTKEGAVNIERVWLSDIFIGEDERYGNNDPAGNDDVEVAVIQSMFAGSLVDEVTADGANVLPPDPFNAEVIASFQEDGDLFRRVVIQDDVITVMVPESSETGEMGMLSFRIGEVDEPKLALFEGIDTVELNLADVLLGFNEAPFFPGGSVNADFIAQTLDDLPSLQATRARAEETRLVSSVSNGELGVAMDPTVDVEMLVFMAVFGGSNDYSVGGIVQAE